MEETSSPLASCIKKTAGARKILVRGKNGCLCNIFGSDTVKQSQPRTEDKGCAETRPQDYTYFNVQRGVARSSDGILLRESGGEQRKRWVILLQVKHKDIISIEG